MQLTIIKAIENLKRINNLTNQLTNHPDANELEQVIASI